MLSFHILISCAPILGILSYLFWSTYPQWGERFILLLVGALCGQVFVLSFYRIIGRKESNCSYRDKPNISEELNSIGIQLDAHFLFNTLSAIKNYIISRSKEEAASYLTTFSKYVRLVLDSSGRELITLAEEIEILKEYITLDQHRIGYTLTFDIVIKEGISGYTCLPALQVKPLVEKILWRSNFNLEKPRHLQISFYENKGQLICKIEDYAERQRVGNIYSVTLGEVVSDTKDCDNYRPLPTRFPVYRAIKDAI